MPGGLKTALHSALLIVLMSPLPGRAEDLRLPGLFSDGAVLQAEKPLPVWGWAKPGTEVTVHLPDQTRTATTGADGRWKVCFDPIKPGGPYEMEIVSGKERRVSRDLLFGEVWLCAGQSNMQWPVWHTPGGKAETAAADLPMVRLFETGVGASPEPVAETAGRWQNVTPQSLSEFSAVAYFFGKSLHARLDRPVGLIDAAWGGTSVLAWTPAAAGIANPAIIAWREGVVRKITAHEMTDDLAARRAPEGVFNRMIAPLIPFAIRGVIWYQGESDVGFPVAYAEAFPVMIQSWREAWAIPELPFYFVQLPNHKKPGDDWAWMREAQACAADLPSTGMAVAVDLGGDGDIHPLEKQTLAGRLAAMVLNATYDRRDVAWGSPEPRKIRRDGENILIEFGDRAGPLVAPAPHLIEGFEIAGEDGNFAPATATLQDAKTIRLESSGREAVFVRYAWTNNPTINLFSRAGWPVAPFRATISSQEITDLP